MRFLHSTAVILVLAASAMAQTFVSDPSSLNWLQTRSGDSISLNAPQQSVLFSEGQTSGSTFLTNFPAVSVAVGQVMTVTASFTTGAVLGTASNSFRFGIFSNAGTPLPASINSNSSNSFADDTGFLASYNFNGASASIFADTDTTTSKLLDSTSASTQISSTSSGTNAAFAASTSYTLVIALSRTLTGYQFTSVLNGGNANHYTVSGNDNSSGTPDSFSEFAIYVGGGAGAVSSLDLTAFSVVIEGSGGGGPVAPVITSQPVSQHVLGGSGAGFTVAAAGTAPIGYQWRKGGEEIPDAVSDTLSLSNVQLSDSGSTYDVVVTNEAGTATSATAILTVSAGGSYSAFNLYGFASMGAGTTGGGEVPESDMIGYRKVSTALELANAIISFNKGNGVKVIEIMNDLDLGWNEIGTEVRNLASTPFRPHATPILHPKLVATGVSLIDIKDGASGLTVFSANGATLRHACLNLKNTSNIIIRNLKFDEMWEWDEATKGDYDTNDWDFIDLSNGGTVSNIWIDHCTFTKAYDGIVDMKKGTQNVTVSWCRYVGDDGATNPNSMVRQQLAALEADKSSYPFYNFLRSNGFSIEDIVQIAQGHDKGHLLGATAKAAENNVISCTFHHQWFANLWDRCVPRLRGGQVHNYNIYVDDSAALIGKRLRDTRANAMSSGNKNTLENTYSFNPFLNGSISTEGAALLVEKSVYIDCLSPLRNNQTDVTDPTYTGKIKSVDSIHVMHNADGTTTTVRGDSTDAGNPMGPTQAVVIPFSWNTIDGNLPYAAPPMDDPAELAGIVAAGAGAGTLTWEKANWLKTAYVDPAPLTFAAWLGAAGLSGDSAAAFSDPDSDGIANLVEFALGLPATDPDLTGLPTWAPENGGMVFRFSRPRFLAGITYTVQTSTDAVNWSDEPSAEVESFTETTETLAIPISAVATKLLVRLRVTQE